MTDKRTPREWPTPLGLILLSTVPVAAGAARIGELASGGASTPDNARFVAVPAPVIVHIIGASVYCLLGAFQFVPSLRRRRPAVHRVSGWLLVPSGLAAAASGMWMALYYPHPADTGSLLTGLRLVVGTVMTTAIVLGVAAVRRRDIARHRTWMIRGYALGLGAGTQVLTQLPWILVVGAPGKLVKFWLMALGWGINVVVAETVVRRRPLRLPASRVTPSTPVKPAKPAKPVEPVEETSR